MFLHDLGDMFTALIAAIMLVMTMGLEAHCRRQLFSDMMFIFCAVGKMLCRISVNNL